MRPLLLMRFARPICQTGLFISLPGWNPFSFSASRRNCCRTSASGAFTVEQSAETRAEVIDAVNEAYKLRSGFVHHGRPVQDAVTFERFAAYGWRFFNLLAQKLHFPTEADFIKAIERVKLS